MVHWGTGDSSPSLELQSLPHPVDPVESAGEGGSQFNLRDVERKQMGKGSRHWARGKYPDDFRSLRKSPQQLPAVFLPPAPSYPTFFCGIQSFFKSISKPSALLGTHFAFGLRHPTWTVPGEDRRMCSFGITQLYHVLHGKNGLPPRKGLLVCSHSFKQ